MEECTKVYGWFLDTKAYEERREKRSCKVVARGNFGRKSKDTQGEYKDIGHLGK